MMQVKTVDAGNVVVRHPRGTVTIRPGDKKPVQRGDEDRALDRKLKGTVLEQLGEHGGDAEPFPDPAEQQRSTDALGRNRQRSVGILVERADEQHLVSELGPRRKQRGKCAGGDEIVGAPEIGDDGLAHGAINVLVLDHLVLRVGEWITVPDPTDRDQLPTPPRMLPAPAHPIIHAATDTPTIKRLAKKYLYLLIAQTIPIDSAAKTRISLRRAQDH